MKMQILVTGGAGYIGSQIAWSLHDHGHVPIIIDDLSTGFQSQIRGLPFFEGDVNNSNLLAAVFNQYKDIETIIHCAAKIVVPESVSNPVDYYNNNICSGLGLLKSVIDGGIRNFVFSSSASLYDGSGEMCVSEDGAILPSSPYSWSKLFFEQILSDVAGAHDLKYLALRYFNPVGADRQGRCGSMIKQPTHLLGSLINSTRQKKPFYLCGTNWDTRDGTAMRDYIDVIDLAVAHVKAVELVREADSSHLKNYRGQSVMNIGTGVGTTVREFVDTYRDVIDANLTVIDTVARPGDSRGAFADNTKARRLLRWSPEESLANSMRRSREWADAIA